MNSRCIQNNCVRQSRTCIQNDSLRSNRSCMPCSPAPKRRMDSGRFQDAASDCCSNTCPLLDSIPVCPNLQRECPRPCREKPDRSWLLKEINECSFAVNDMLLYLDTHPCDEAALAYFMEHKQRRVDALKEYAKYYGPLTIDTADDEASRSFAWAETPWPWEGGC